MQEAHRRRRLPGEPQRVGERLPELAELQEGGDVAAIEAALRGGADVDVKDEDGATALMYAASEGQAGAAAALLKAGADRAAKATAGSGVHVLR